MNIDDNQDVVTWTWLCRWTEFVSQLFGICGLYLFKLLLQYLIFFYLTHLLLRADCTLVRVICAKVAMIFFIFLSRMDYSKKIITLLYLHWICPQLSFRDKNNFFSKTTAIIKNKQKIHIVTATSKNKLVILHALYQVYMNH